MKTTKITSLLTALAMLTGTAATMPMMLEPTIAGSATSVPVFTGTYEQLTFESNNSDITIIGCQKDATEVVIPAEIDGAPVIAVGANAFRGCKKLTSVTIPDGVKHIERDAFLQCYKLASVNIPDGVTYIGEGAFSETALTTVTIPDSVYEFGAGAFSFCDSLKEFAISENAELYQLIDGVLFNNGGRTLVAYPCGKDGDTYTVPDGVTKIGDGAFSGSDLTSVVIPDGVTIIGDYAFNMCNILESVTIPESVMSIGDSAFCFDDGYVPEVIYYGGSEEQWKEIYFYDGNEALEEASIYYNWGEVLTTGDLTYTKHDDHVIIRGCDESATEVEIPAEIDGVPVTSIEKNAFKGCTDLTSVTIPDSVTSIRGYAFSCCSGLTSINIPDGVTSIGDYAFAACSGLTTITIPNSVTSIGKDAFAGCSGLTTITIPDSVTSIGERTFFECSGLTTITIPDGVTSIRLGAFWSCSDLTTITIPDSVASISWYAFYDCSNLTTITILNPECEIYDEDFSVYRGEDTIDKNATIRGYANSTAQAYAEKYGRKFEVIDESPALPLGDLNGDDAIDATDAAFLLSAAASAGAGGESGLTAEQTAAADLNDDGVFNASDASLILMYAAYSGAGGELGITEFLAQL